MGVHENFGQLDVRLRQALDYDNSVAPADGQVVGWWNGGGTFQPQTVVSQYQRGPIGGTAASTLVTQTYSLDATGAIFRRFTLTGNPTLSVPTGGVDGQKLTLWLLASGADRTFTFASGYEVSPVVPSRVISIAAGTWERFDLECRAGTWRLIDSDQALAAPAAHASTHGSSGNDPLTPSAIGAASASHSHPSVIFQGRATAAQTMAASGTNYPVALAAEDFDTDNGHDNSTNNSRYTAQRAMTVQVDGAVAYGTGSALRGAQINKNGSVVLGSYNQLAASSTSLNIVQTNPVFVSLAVGDYLELVTAQTQGTNIATTVSSTVTSSR